MTLQVDTVYADLDVHRDTLAPADGGGALPLTTAARRAELRATLRPLVLEILAEEMERLTRRYGR